MSTTYDGLLAASITGRLNILPSWGQPRWWFSILFVVSLRISRRLHLITATAVTSSIEKQLIRFSRDGRKSFKRLSLLAIAGFLSITWNDVSAQAFSFSTLAGQAQIAGSTNGVGNNALFKNPSGVAVDSGGNLFVADYGNHTIRKVTPTGLVTTFAGTSGSPGYTDGPGSAARLNGPYGVVVDNLGNIFVADLGNSVIRKITTSGIVSTLAGSPSNAGTNDGIGSTAQFNAPCSVAVDNAGYVYVADSGNSTIRKVSYSGVVTTLAGSAGARSYLDGIGSNARFDHPNGVAADSSGNVFVADTFNFVIRMITPSGVVSTLAGFAGQSGTVDGIGSLARFNRPFGVCVDSSGNVYVADTGSGTIRKVTKTGAVTTVAGIPLTLGSGDGVGGNAVFWGPSGITVDARGNLYVADIVNYNIRTTLPSSPIIRVDPINVSLVAGNDAKFSVSAYGNPLPAYRWQFFAQGGSAWQDLNDSSIYGGSATSSLSIKPTADMSGAQVRCVVTNSQGTAISSSGILSVFIPYAITTLVGRNGSGSADGPISVASFNGPTGVALDSVGTLYVADARNYTIRKISTSGLVSTIAGVRGIKGSADGPAATATFDYMNGIAVDTAGNVFIADTVNNTIRRISSGGIVTTIAGLAGSAGSVDGTGSAARFNGPVGIATDNSGNLYVTDYGNHTIRKISSGGTVTTLAGLAGNRASYDGTGNTASFSRPWGLVADASGNLYVADSSSGTIRKVTAAGVVTTFAGAPQVGGSIDGVGTAARFTFPYGISIDAAGNLYAIENSGGLVRKITSGALVTTIAGNNSSAGFLDGVGGSAKFNSPIGIVADPAGRFYVADSSNNTIRVGSLVAAPLVQEQSISQTTTIGQNASFFVLASANAPLSYQWLKDGAPIVGATKETLALSNIQMPNAGSYSVVVSNGAGSVTGSSIQLTVNPAVAPVTATQPVSQTVNAGTNATFTATATGTAPLSYQWRKEGTPITGATNATFTLSAVQTSDAASYTVVVTNVSGSSTSNPAILAVTIPNPGRLINLSVLTDIATVGDDFTLGYVVGGAGTFGAKPLVIRAAGPSLGALGVPGTLDDPKLELFAGSTKTSENDNWGGSVPLTSALAAVGAFAYTGPASRDAATTASITTRDNSVRVSAVGSGTGKVIAEIYDATPAASFTTATPRLINVSVRKNLGAGLTMGFVVVGATSAKVLVRGIGPTLGAFGVAGTVVDPQLTLFNSSSVKIGENNDWSGSPELTAGFASVGAFALPATSKDAALLVTLAPGNYTAQVTGVNGTTGVALVEVYEVP